MIGSKDIDKEKANLVLTHLSKAFKKISEKDFAKERLQQQVNRLKNQSRSKGYRKEIAELEKRLAEVLEKEDEILRHHKSREAATRRVREKINEVEERLTKYIESKRKRDQRVRELEEKIKRRFSVEQRQVDILAEQLGGLEKLYSKISGEKQYSKAQLSKVKKKIESLKKKLAKVK